MVLAAVGPADMRHHRQLSCKYSSTFFTSSGKDTTWFVVRAIQKETQFIVLRLGAQDRTYRTVQYLPNVWFLQKEGSSSFVPISPISSSALRPGVMKVIVQKVRAKEEQEGGEGNN